jgi:hypothetical protein
MAIPRKGSRLITVDGTLYRWTVRPKPTYSAALAWTPLTFAVEQADAPGQILLVSTASPRLDNWLGLPGAPVTPRLVEHGVRTAIATGWLPSRSGSAFRLSLNG